MPTDVIARVEALATKAEELANKGQALRAVENFGRAAEAACALGSDNLVAIHMQLRQGGVLGGFIVAAMDNDRGDSPLNIAALRADCVALLSNAVQATERRRVAGTLLDGTCRALEVDWRFRQIKQYNGTRITNAVAACWAALVGYEQFLRAASNVCRLLSYAGIFASECSQSLFESFAQHVVVAAEMMQQPRRHVNTGMQFEAEFPARLRDAVALCGANGLNERLVQMLAGAWQRLQSSGVLQERRVDEGITAVERELNAYQAAANKSMSALGLRKCTLASCGAKEAHTSHFKACAACKAVVYCSREHQVADWPAHKAACKAAHKAAADEAGPSSTRS